MRNLIRFVIRNHPLFLFIVLEFFCFSLIQSNNRYQRAAFVNTSSSISGSMYNTYRSMKDYVHLLPTIDSLMAENARLRGNQAHSVFLDTFKTYVVADTALLQCYEYISARVIRNSINQYNNYLTLNRGAKHGIQPGMGVIGPHGVVGIVTNVSRRFSSCMSLLHHSWRLRGKLKKNNQHGPVVWKEQDPLHVYLNHIGKYVRVEVGDTVVSTGFSNYFPENVPIGVVTEKTLKPGDNHWNLKIRLSTDFGRLQYVYVVNYLLKEEQEALENVSRFGE